MMTVSKRKARFSLPPTISIQLHDARWKTLLKPYTKTVRGACEETLNTRNQKREKLEIAIVLADDEFIRGLNKTYRGKDKATNVLSFVGEGEHLGDIILALETIEREAKEQQKTFRSHAIHLIVHGMLHLLGYDHERSTQAEIMEELEIKILKKLMLSNPYL